MFYIVDLEDASEDILKSLEPLLVLIYFKQGRYLHINKEYLDFYRAHEILVNEYEIINVEKLKEILLIKHLRN